MKVIVVGGTGTIGKAITEELAQRHTIIVVGQTTGDIQADVTDTDFIKQMYKAVGPFDALVAAMGAPHFGYLPEMTEELYYVGIRNKLMSQVNLVILGLRYINDGGSFTLTSGLLNHDPIRQGSSAAMVNGAVDGFVKSAALEMPRGIRINAVSPTVITEALTHYGDYFYGFESVPAKRVALAYSKSVEGAQTGQIYRVGYTI